MSRYRRLQLVRSGGQAPRPRPVLRKRTPRRPSRSRRLLEALLLLAAGCGVLVLLLLLPRAVDLDSLLLVSTAIGHLIDGITQLLLGLIQLLAVLLLVSLALLALVLLLGGLVRLVRALLPPPAPATKPGPPPPTSPQPRRLGRSGQRL